MKVEKSATRLVCIDALRGLDMFFLIGLAPIVSALYSFWDAPQAFRLQWTHVDWEGFTMWDLVMPLFLFTSGIAMPFSNASCCSGRQVFVRAFKRICLLWFWGMVVQGNLRALDGARLYLFSNTLQAIAAGYMLSLVPVLKLKWRGHLIYALSLLVVFWAAMQWISVNGFGGGDWSSEKNLAEGIDRLVLGRWRDQATVGDDGQVIFSPTYAYTWILSSLGFAATVMLGVVAGDILRSALSPWRRVAVFVLAGMVCAGGGWGLHGLGVPVIKHIFSSSMVLVAAGYSFLLLAFFYVYCDILQLRRGMGVFLLFGQNALLMYIVGEICDFRPCVGDFVFGLEPYITTAYPVLVTAGHVGILIAIAWVCKRFNWFLRA